MIKHSLLKMKSDALIRGITFMLLGNIALSIMTIAVKIATELSVSPYICAFFRFLGGATILGTLAMAKNIHLDFSNSKVLFLRGIFGGFAVTFLYISIAHLGIGKASVICFSYPIFATIFSSFFLKEKVSLKTWICIVAAFIGIYLLQVKNLSNIFYGFDKFGRYELLAICAAASAGAAVVSIKKLHSSESTFSIFFAQCTIGIWFVVCPTVYNMNNLNNDFYCLILLLAIGVTTTLGQLSITEGYKHLPVTSGATLALMLPIFNLIAGVLIFNESLYFNKILGSIIIIISCAMVIRRNK